MMPRPMKPTASAMRAGGYRPLCRQRDLARLGQVLMRRAVSVLGERGPLARRAATGRRAALDPAAFDVVAGHRHRREVLLREGHVAVDDAVDPLLGRHREVDSDVVEQRLRRFREVVPVGRQAVDAGLARAQYALVIARAPLAGLVIEDVSRQLAIDGPTKAIHVVPLGPIAGFPQESGEALIADGVQFGTRGLLTSR